MHICTNSASPSSFVITDYVHISARKTLIQYLYLGQSGTEVKLFFVVQKLVNDFDSSYFPQLAAREVETKQLTTLAVSIAKNICCPEHLKLFLKITLWFRGSLVRLFSFTIAVNVLVIFATVRIKDIV